MHCRNCGAPLNDGEKFCSHCGNPLEADLSGSQVNSVPPTPPQIPNTGVPYAQPMPQVNQMPKKKGSTALLILLIGIAILVIILAIAFLGGAFSGIFRPANGKGNAYIDGPAASKQQTILVYMDGSDLESEYGMATGDLTEMMESGFNSQNINLIVYTGGTTNWQNYDIPNDTNMIYRVTPDGIEALADMGQTSMGEADTLTSFINFGYEYFPADQYGLILWDHGGGAVSGYGVDDVFNFDGLTLDELDAALASSAIASKQKLEFVGFDACLMATLETAYTLQKYADYMIGSEELEPGYGWNYAALTEISNADHPDGIQIGQCIIDNFLQYYEQESPSDEITLSLLDLSKTNDTVQALENLVTTADASLLQGNYSGIAKQRSNSKSFGSMGAHGGETDMVDAYHLAEQMNTMFPAESESLMQAVNSMVLFKGASNVENANGVSIYFPFADKESTPERVGVYKTLGFSPTYTDFISDFAETLTGAPLSEIDVAEITPESNEAGDMEIKLPQDELDNICEIYFTLWQQAEDGSDYYIQYGETSGVEIDENGVITTTFDGTWATLNGNLVCLYELERTDAYTKCSIPALLNGEDVDLIVVFDESNPNGLILGAMPVLNEDTGMPAKYLLPIETGDKITLYYYSELFDAEETAEQEYSQWWEGETFTVDGDLQLEFSDVEDNSTYLYGFYIVDTQGNGYYTDFIEATFTAE